MTEIQQQTSTISSLTKGDGMNNKTIINSQNPSFNKVEVLSKPPIASSKLIIIIAAALAASIIIPLIIILSITLTEKKKSKNPLIVSEKNGKNENIVNINANYPLVSAKDSEYIYIPIFGTNDIHGFFFPRITEINQTLSYKRGGLEFFSKYLEIIREEFGENRVLWLDAGDHQTGGAELELSNNEILTEFMNSAKVTATTIGNHEYDLDAKVFKEKIKKSNFPYIAGNILNNETHEFFPLANGTSEINGHKKYIVKEIKLNRTDKIKIGIIGVGHNMNYESGGNKVNPNKYPNMEWKDYAQSIKDLVEEIKKEHNDLNAIVGIIHLCSICKTPINLNLYNKSTSQEACEDINDAFNPVMEKLEPGLLDAVIGGHTHESVHHWINDMPVTSILSDGVITNILYLPFKKDDNGKYKVVKDQVKIEGPLPNCEKIFNNTKNCMDVSTEEEYLEAGPLTKFSYRGKTIGRSSYVSSIYNKYYNTFKSYSEDELARLYGMQALLVGRNYSGDDYLINLFMDILKNETQTEVAILNTGTYRSSWNVGKITKENVMSMFPFVNYVCTTTIKGKDLINVLDAIQTGAKHYYSTSGLKQIMLVDQEGNPIKLKEASLWVDGKETPIDNNTDYSLGALDYIFFQYGDDFSKLLNLSIYKFENVECEDRIIGEVIQDGLEKLKNINITEYKDPNHPRLIEEVVQS